MNKLTQTKNFMPICMILFSLTVYIIGILIVADLSSWTMGMLLGLLFSLLKLKLMEHTFNKAVLLPEAKAKNYATFHYMVRYLLTGLVLIIAALAPSISILGVFWGLISMKVAAYCHILFKGIDKDEVKPH